MIGMDSSAIIDLFRGDESIKKVLDRVNEPLAMNQISYLELMFGLDSGNVMHQREEEFLDNFFNASFNLDLGINESKMASKISWLLKKKGKTIDPFDCAIAGIFLANGVDKIITRNVKHFKDIPKLKVISY